MLNRDNRGDTFPVVFANRFDFFEKIHFLAVGANGARQA